MFLTSFQVYPSAKIKKKPTSANYTEITKLGQSGIFMFNLFLFSKCQLFHRGQGLLKTCKTKYLIMRHVHYFKCLGLNSGVVVGSGSFLLILLPHLTIILFVLQTKGQKSWEQLWRSSLMTNLSSDGALWWMKNLQYFKAGNLDFIF